MKKKNRKFGIILIVLGASFWGIGGTVSQYLFQNQQINVNWFVTTRLIIGGILLLGSQVLVRRPIFTIWKEVNDRKQLLIFSVLGMLLVQYSYMISISIGNAAVATLLQYLAPVFIIIYLVLTKRQRFMRIDATAIVLTVIGTYLLLTNGSIQNLSVPAGAVVWGLISGISLAFYTLYVSNLLQKFPSIVVVGWAMLIAGIIMNFIHPIWAVDISTWGTPTYLGLFFTIIFGTAIAFWFFIKSLEYLLAKETILIGTLEPLTAVISSVLWLKLSLGIGQLIGGLMIILLVLVLSLAGEKSNEPEVEQMD